MAGINLNMKDRVSVALHPNEWKLVAALLRMAADQFGNHGCNDLPDELVALLTTDQWKRIAIDVTDDDTDDPGAAHDDAGLMGYYSTYFEQMADT